MSDSLFIDKVDKAIRASEAEIQFRVLVKEFEPRLVVAISDLERANRCITSINQNPLDFSAQALLKKCVDDKVLECDPVKLEFGMDAYSYGGGKSDDLDEDDVSDADYYYTHIVAPILKRYGITEVDLNKIHKEKGHAFWRNFIENTNK